VECDCIAEADTENDFALWISPKLTPAEAAQRKIITRAGVKDLLERHDPRAVVIRSADWGGWGIPFRDALQKNGYKLVRTIGRAEIYWTTQK
jgi:putative SOS response-associated peptidase YedK